MAQPILRNLGYPAGLFALAVTVIVAGWWWLGRHVPLPASPLGPAQKLDCVSYAPFRASQTPLDEATRIDPAQIEQDLAQLAGITGCVRTYSIEHGLDRIPEIARRHGLKVIQGLWLSSHADKNRAQIEGVIALANRFPDVIESVVVGNEVLLRGEMSAVDLANIVRGVKAQVPVRVTYADVWEFWLRFRELQSAVDYVMVHILPYWEDFPIPAPLAAAHVDSIRRRVAGEFPGKEIVIGEMGWPSAGRMREGALPSPVNQARVLHEVLAAAKAGDYRVNLIEAYDQPWKRRLEGTVGGHWGLFDGDTREMKFAWGGSLSNHPGWRWPAAGGVALAALVFAAALARRRNPAGVADAALWPAVAGMAATGGILVPWTVADVPLESLGVGGWMRGVALAGVALAAPLAAAAALAGGVAVPGFARVLGRAEFRPQDPLALALGLLLVAVTVLAVMAALALDFDPRYRDFPYAPLTAAVLPFLLLVALGRRPAGRRGHAESAAAALLALSIPYIVLNEGLANWQSLWLCAAFAGLAVTLLSVSDADARDSGS
jgi:glucan 1,3-beta-glucosidase